MADTIMTNTENKVSLIGCMQDVPDPGAPYNQKHKFLDIIIIAVTAVLSGMDTWNEIEGVAAIDGKTVRRSRDEAKEKRPIHVVSA